MLSRRKRVFFKANSKVALLCGLSFCVESRRRVNSDPQLAFFWGLALASLDPHLDTKQRPTSSCCRCSLLHSSILFNPHYGEQRQFCSISGNVLVLKKQTRAKRHQSDRKKQKLFMLCRGDKKAAFAKIPVWKRLRSKWELLSSKCRLKIRKCQSRQMFNYPFSVTFAWWLSLNSSTFPSEPFMTTQKSFWKLDMLTD